MYVFDAFEIVQIPQVLIFMGGAFPIALVLFLSAPVFQR